MNQSAEAVIKALKDRSQSIACAESITGGAISAALVEIAGASQVFLGSIIAYSKEVKINQLGLNKELIESQGLVSGEVALAMAEGVRQKLGSTWAISSTGVAGPENLEGSSPGQIWVGILGPNTEQALHLALSGSRLEIINGAVESALGSLSRILIS